jgi:hypothetical protein
MRQDDLNEELDRRPFRPFRIHLSNGVFFDIRTPNMVRMTRSTMHIGLPLEGALQRFAVVALVHIVWLEVLLPAP